MSLSNLIQFIQILIYSGPRREDSAAEEQGQPVQGEVRPRVGQCRRRRRRRGKRLIGGGSGRCCRQAGQVQVCERPVADDRGAA